MDKLGYVDLYRKNFDPFLICLLISPNLGSGAEVPL